MKTPAPRIRHDDDAAGIPLYLVVVPVFKPAHALFIEVHIPENMRRELTLRIKAAVFLLEIDALQLGSLNRIGLNIGQPALDPGERTAVIKLVENVFLRESGSTRERFRGGLPILDLIRNGKNRIHLDTDRQLIPVAIVDIAAPRTDIERALLLALSALLVVRRVDDMKKIEAGPDRHSPKPHDGYQDVNPP